MVGTSVHQGTHDRHRKDPLSEVQMVDVVSPPYSAGHRMPVDFNPYLLSSSPPASSLELLTYAFDSARRSSPAVRDGPRDYINNSRNFGSSLNERRHGPLKSIIIKPEEPVDFTLNSPDESEETTSASSNASSGANSAPTSPSSPGRLKKKVSFADHKGLALVTVKIMSEPSDQPPQLRPEVLASITQGATAGVTEQPPLKLCFAQPASDYLAFRDRLEKDFVSLENVILRDYNVAGTIKVKNISFEKKVLVRFTYDSWENHHDVMATFVPGPGESAPHVYDTFSFEFSIPPNFNMEKIIQFAVCYQVGDKQYWDSYNGLNYKIVPITTTPVTSTQTLSGGHTQWSANSWPEFTCWTQVNTSTPYW